MTGCVPMSSIQENSKRKLNYFLAIMVRSILLVPKMYNLKSLHFKNWCHHCHVFGKQNHRTENRSLLAHTFLGFELHFRTNRIYYIVSKPATLVYLTLNICCVRANNISPDPWRSSTRILECCNF